MAQSKVPKNLKNLFAYDILEQRGERIYAFYDFDGTEKEVSLAGDDLLAEKLRCPRDGVRIVNYSGDPHRVSECPNCHASPPFEDSYSRERDLSDIDNRIKIAEANLVKLKATRLVIKDSNHPIVQANLRDSSMEKRE